MGFGGISPFQLIIILLIVLLLFGGKRLRGLGSDLGSAIKGFRKSMDDSDLQVNEKNLESNHQQEMRKDASEETPIKKD